MNQASEVDEEEKGEVRERREDVGVPEALLARLMAKEAECERFSWKGSQPREYEESRLGYALCTFEFRRELISSSQQETREVYGKVPSE